MKVVYGHTDSIYVKCESIEKGEEICAMLNESVREYFPNILGLKEHPVTLEFEKYFETLGVGATKNRNAGMISWKDGDFLDNKEFVMTGFTAKRISETALAKEVQIKVLKMWVMNNSEEEILDYLVSIYQDTLQGRLTLDKILKRSRYKEERFHVYCTVCKKSYHLEDVKCRCTLPATKKSALTTAMKSGKGWKSAGKRPTVGSGILGVLMYNKTNTTPIEDTYLYLKMKDYPSMINHPITGNSFVPNYMAGLTEEDFKTITPDWEHYAQSVVKKASPIFDAMDWDTSKITKDVHQRTLDEWW
tara:strand:- start:7308 stop:8216 length:909 start_codon:yes stop_codon:yes gene_type:complete